MSSNHASSQHPSGTSEDTDTLVQSEPVRADLAAVSALRDSVPAPALDALQEAFKRAETSKVALLNSPDMINGETLAAELGLTRATVDNRRVANKLLAVEFGSKRGFRYPRFQIALVQEHRSAFEAVLTALAKTGNWDRYRFFLQRSPELDGATPVDALLSGALDSAVHAAENWVAGEQGGG